MFPQLSRSARRTALLIALVSAVSLGVQVWHLMSVLERDLAATLLDMARYFTILTHVLVVVTFAIVSRPWRNGVSGPWLAALTLSMVMVGAVYHLLLSELVDFTGLGWWADQGLHTIGPLAVFLWWLFHAPKRRLVYADLPIFVMWPSVYAAYVLGRGAQDGVYPYPFIDLPVIGEAAAAVNLAALLLVFLLGGVAMIAIGRYADR
ncbi:Pr6Pr family membrane protein [Roseicyclus marinus]|uniref:Pr6Pr family membrane protein n=1 Tax=Roseicyclus marinus TaxID=2161673 RepID=UPI00240F40D4|nr:Pr6Pr family membrane protein [Roseicyclus marinus]MDG3042648.1 Pr6Pr family membrane protein [Roseicyclus marinus]